MNPQENLTETLTPNPNVLESYNRYQTGEKIVLEPYIVSRYICPVCHKRYGEPSTDGFMDIERCPEHKRKGEIL